MRTSRPFVSQRRNKMIMSMMLACSMSASGIAHAQENENAAVQQVQSSIDATAPEAQPSVEQTEPEAPQTSVEETAPEAPQPSVDQTAPESQESTDEVINPVRTIYNNEGQKIYFQEHHTPGATYKNGVLTVRQGAGVYTENGLCTAGYFDNKNKRMLIAAHCISDRLGKPMYVVDQYYKARKIGNAPVETHYNRNLQRNDWAWIDLDKNVTGVNGYSGDTMIHPSEVSPGDQACSIGVNNPVVKCGAVKNVDGSVVFLNRGASGIPGDSGGPGWIPGKGFIGVYSLTSTDRESKNYTFGAFTYPEYDTGTSRVKVNRGEISFAAANIVEPDKAPSVISDPSLTKPTIAQGIGGSSVREVLVSVVIFASIVALGIGIYNNFVRK